MNIIALKTGFGDRHSKLSVSTYAHLLRMPLFNRIPSMRLISKKQNQPI